MARGKPNVPTKLHQDDREALGYLQSQEDRLSAVEDSIAGIGDQAIAFISLSDTFPSYAELGGYSLRVKSTEDGIEAVSQTSFTTSDQAITASTALAGIPHGLTLTSKPKITAFLVNQTTEFGYAVGELLGVPPNVGDYWNSGTATHFSLGCSISLDATNVYITYGTHPNVFSVAMRSTGSYNVITTANWKLRVIVEP